MTNSEYIRLTAQIAVLKEVTIDYSGQTIDNIINQLEARTIYKTNKNEKMEMENRRFCGVGCYNAHRC